MALQYWTKKGHFPASAVIALQVLSSSILNSVTQSATVL